MSETLLNVDDTRRRLGKLSISTFLRLEPILVARGLKRVRIGRKWVYQEASLDTVIRDMAEKEDEVTAEELGSKIKTNKDEG